MKRFCLLILTTILNLMILCSCGISNIKIGFNTHETTKPSLEIVKMVDLKYCGFDKIKGYGDGLFVVALNDKYGFADEELQAVIPLEYDNANEFSEGLAFVKKDGKYGFIDKSNNVIIPFIYDGAHFGFHKGTAIVSINNKWGIIKDDGSVLVPLEYDLIHSLSSSQRYVTMKKDGKYGCLDKDDGRVIIEPMYDELGEFNDKIAKARLNGKYGCIDLNNKIRIPFEYYEMSDTRKDTVIVKKGKSYGVLNSDNSVVLPFEEIKTEYTLGIGSVVGEENNLITRGEFANLEKKFSCYDTNGKVIIPKGKYHYIVAAYNDVIVVVDEESRWGLVHRSGKELLPCEYDSISSFYMGIADVEKGGKKGVVDEKGNVAFVDGEFDTIGSFVSGYALASKDNKYGIIEMSGNIIFSLEYDYIFIRKNCVIIKKDGKYGSFKMIFNDDRVVSLGVGER